MTLLTTEDSWTPTVLRAALGAVMLPHGAQKLLGWFGGYGFASTMSFFTDTMHLPLPLAFAVIFIESFGSLALLAGAGTRAAAAGIIAVMLGAIGTVHAQHGFFMNWLGGQKGEGFEYHLLAIGMALALLLAGGGRLSVDRAVSGAG